MGQRRARGRVNTRQVTLPPSECQRSRGFSYGTPISESWSVKCRTQVDQERLTCLFVLRAAESDADSVLVLQDGVREAGVAIFGEAFAD